MLSGISASLGVNSPSYSSGLGEHEMTVRCPGKEDVLVVCTGWVVCPGFSKNDFSFAFSGILEGVGSSSPNT